MTGGAAYLDALAAAAEDASAAEAEYRRRSAERIRQLAGERAIAFRRLNLMRNLAPAVSGADSVEAAATAAAAALRARLGWTGENQTHAAIVSRFAGVARALHSALRDGVPPFDDVTAELAAFERWYTETFAASFWDLFEHHMPETPLVDF
jgi:hypothetical protein